MRLQRCYLKLIIHVLQYHDITKYVVNSQETLGFYVDVLVVSAVLRHIGDKTESLDIIIISQPIEMRVRQHRNVNSILFLILCMAGRKRQNFIFLNSTSCITDRVKKWAWILFIRSIVRIFVPRMPTDRAACQEPIDLPSRSLAPTYLPAYLLDLIQLDLIRLPVTLVSLYWPRLSLKTHFQAARCVMTLSLSR